MPTLEHVLGDAGRGLSQRNPPHLTPHAAQGATTPRLSTTMQAAGRANRQKAQLMLKPCSCALCQNADFRSLFGPFVSIPFSQPLQSDVWLLEQLDIAERLRWSVDSLFRYGGITSSHALLEPILTCLVDVPLVFRLDSFSNQPWCPTLVASESSIPCSLENWRPFLGLNDTGYRTGTQA